MSTANTSLMRDCSAAPLRREASQLSQNSSFSAPGSCMYSGMLLVSHTTPSSEGGGGGGATPFCEPGPAAAYTSRNMHT
jgi:hypothetical protein